jgi:ribosomal protein S18 acetylase RimI-like enzyme
MTAYEKVAKQIKTEILGEGKDEEVWYLHMLAVSPGYQGKGIGKALVRYVTDIVFA